MTNPALLLVEPDLARRGELAMALGFAQVHAVGSRAEAATQLQTSATDLVLARATDAGKLVRDVERLQPGAQKVFLCAREDATGFALLTRLASEGQAFKVIDSGQSPADIGRQVEALLLPREQQRIAIEVATSAGFEVEGRWFTGTLEDISARGVSLGLPSTSYLERLTVGTQVRQLTIQMEGVKLLESESAVIRHARLDAQAGQVKLGLRLEEVAQPPKGGIQKISDPARIAALIQRALRRHTPMHLRSLGDAHELIVLEDLEPTQVNDLRLLSARIASHAAVRHGDIFEFCCEYGGRGYSGNIAILGNKEGRLVLSSPAVLFQAHRRKALRNVTARMVPVTIAFSSPLTGQQLLRRTIDHNGDGVSFLIDAEREALPPGLILNSVALTLGSGKTFDCRARVRYAIPLPATRAADRSGSGGRPFQIGLQLLDVSDALRSALLDSLITAGSSKISEADSVPFRSVWRLMEEAGRSYHDYPSSLEGPHLEVLGAAQNGLVRAHGRLGKAFAARDTDDKLVGYAAGLRLYSKTWLLQGLTIPPGFHRGETLSQQLSSLVVQYGEALGDVDFIRCIWSVDTRWTDRLSTWIARQLETPGLTALRRLAYLHRSASAAAPRAPSMPIRAGTSDDHAWIERFFRGRDESLHLLSDDLGSDDLELATLGALSSAAGLHRRRRLFVVDGERAPLAFALAEESSYGMNWQETGNAFRIHTVDPVHPGAHEAERSLVSHCISHYRQRGQGYTVGFETRSDLSVWRDAGFEAHDIMEWTFHKSLIRGWQEFATALFERVQRVSNVKVTHAGRAA